VMKFSKSAAVIFSSERKVVKFIVALRPLI
jgi:hypothetical protein